MKPKKSIVILTTLAVILLFFGLFLNSMYGEPTGKRTQTQVGNNIQIYAELENITGWRVITAGLTPACIASTFGANWTLLPLIIPLTAICAVIFVLLPWRKREAIKRDGFLLLGMGIILVVSQGSWRPTCPADVVSHWTHVNGPASDGALALLFGMLLMLISGAMIIFAKPPKPIAENVNRVIEYRTCFKCKESVDKTLAVCPNCGNQLN